jgi:hypothetical protein
MAATDFLSGVNATLHLRLANHGSPAVHMVRLRLHVLPSRPLLGPFTAARSMMGRYFQEERQSRAERGDEVAREPTAPSDDAIASK